MIFFLGLMNVKGDKPIISSYFAFLHMCSLCWERNLTNSQNWERKIEFSRQNYSTSTPSSDISKSETNPIIVWKKYSENLWFFSSSFLQIKIAFES